MRPYHRFTRSVLVMCTPACSIQLEACQWSISVLNRLYLTENCQASRLPRSRIMTWSLSSSYLLLLYLHQAPLAALEIAPRTYQPSYGIYVRRGSPDDSSFAFHEIDPLTVNFSIDSSTDEYSILWNHTENIGYRHGNATNQSGFASQVDSLYYMDDALYNYLRFGDLTAILPKGSMSNGISNFIPNCGDSICSSFDMCSLIFYCLMKTSLDLGTPDVGACLTLASNETRSTYDWSSWNCLIYLYSYSKSEDDFDYQYAPCSEQIWNLTQRNWIDLMVDSQMQVALQGGVDASGVYWEGRRVGETFAETVERQFWASPGNRRCSITTPRVDLPDCSTVGSFTAIALGRTLKPMRIPWVLLATTALANINQQLVNQYSELKDALESLGLDTFTIDDFFPTKDAHLGLQNSLAGLGAVFSILGGFIPVAGPAIAAAGTIASAVGTFLASSVASNDPQEAQKAFSTQVLDFRSALLSGLDDAASKLFSGEQIPDPKLGFESFNISDMIASGT